jgi:plastocyanin
LPRFFFLLAIPLALVVFAAACGDDDDATSTATATAPSATATHATTPSATTSASASASASAAASAGASITIPPGAPEIDQKNLEFTKDSLSVKVGDTVYFHSQDDAIHTVDVNGTNESGTMHNGDTFAWKAPSAGTYQITCDFHPDMHATITVS